MDTSKSEFVRVCGACLKTRRAVAWGEYTNGGECLDCGCLCGGNDNLPAFAIPRRAAERKG